MNLLAAIAGNVGPTPFTHYHAGLAQRQAQQRQNELLDLERQKQQNVLARLAMDRQMQESQLAAHQFRMKQYQEEQQRAARRTAAQQQLGTKFGLDPNTARLLQESGLIQNYLAQKLSPRERQRRMFTIGNSLVDETGRVIYRGEGAAIDVQGESALRRQFEAQQPIKDLGRITKSVLNLRDLSAAENPISQVGIIYELITAFDPESVVQVSEQGLITGSGGVASKFESMWNKAIGEGALSEKTRENIIKTAEILYENTYDQAVPVKERFDRISVDYGFDPYRITGPMGSILEKHRIMALQKRKEEIIKKLSEERDRSKQITDERSKRLGELSERLGRIAQ